MLFRVFCRIIPSFLLLLTYLKFSCAAAGPSTEMTTLMLYFGQPWLHGYAVTGTYRKPKDRYLRPATVKVLHHTFFARGFAVLIMYSSSFNPHTRFLEHSAEYTGGLHRSIGTLSRTSTTLTPWLVARYYGVKARYV